VAAGADGEAPYFVTSTQAGVAAASGRDPAAASTASSGGGASASSGGMPVAQSRTDAFVRK
jgi:hypothetical protein